MPECKDNALLTAGFQDVDQKSRPLIQLALQDLVQERREGRDYGSSVWGRYSPSLPARVGKSSLSSQPYARCLRYFGI
jgi:hypothetical protein